jgi:SAM-dependent methyltransferase
MRKEEYDAMFELEERLWWYQGMRAITGAILDRTLRERGDVRLLDVGCGTGYSAVWLRDRFKLREVVGVDLFPEAAAFWHRRGLDTAAISSVRQLPFAEGEFGIVTCFDVIYQLSLEDAGAAVAEMTRVLAPGGVLLIREPAYDWLRGGHDVAVATRHRYRLSELRRMLGASGLVTKRTTYANCLLFGIAVGHRLLSKLRGDDASDVKAVAGPLNRALASVLKIEASLHRYTVFPFGLSVIVLAEKGRPNHSGATGAPSAQ